LTSWNNSDATQRFSVYRNNVIVSLVDALADTFPVTQALVGEPFFRAMAKLFAYAHPPKSPIMACYGNELPDFIEGFPPASSVPYLADVARLEMLRVAAYHAADVASVPAERIAEVLANEFALPSLRLTLHPSVKVLQSRYAVVSLWASHQGMLELSSVVPDSAETALILRAGLNVEIVEIQATTGRFIQCIQAGDTFGTALEAATVDNPVFDLSPILGLLIQKGMLSALYSTRRLK